jgi:hypothetical protein
MSNPLGSFYGGGAQCAALTKENAAYLAGFIDGEGCIGALRRTYRRTQSRRVVLHLTISSTNLDVLQWIARTTGLGRATKHWPRNEKASVFYMWQVTNSAAASVARQLLPFLQIKTPQAELLVSSDLKLIADRFLSRDAAWQRDVTIRFGDMNRRGRARSRSGRVFEASTICSG